MTLLFLPLVSLAAHQGHLLNYGVPLLVFVIAYIFAKASPRDFIRLVVIVLVFSPFMRRLADYFGGGFTDPSPILLAPLVASLAGLRTLQFSKDKLKGLMPVTLALFGLLNGALVSIILRVKMNSFALATLRQATPVLLAVYIVQHSEDASEMMETALEAFRWSTLVSVVYALYQCAFLPPWDLLWFKSLMDTGAAISYGRPFPFEFRLFGTLHSCGIAAEYWGLGTIAWFFSKNRFRIIAVGVMMTAICLTLVRTEWLCLPIAIFAGLILMRDRWKANMSTVVSLAAFGTLTIALMGAANPDIIGNLSDRITGIGQSSNDESYRSRTAAIAAGANILRSEPFGRGLGFLDSPDYSRTPMANPSNATPSDLGLEGMVFDLGFLGTALYLSGVAMVVAATWRVRKKGNSTGIVCTSILLSLTHLWSNNVFAGPSAFMLWLYAGFVCAIDARSTVPEGLGRPFTTPSPSDPLNLLTPSAQPTPASAGKLS